MREELFELDVFFDLEELDFEIELDFIFFVDEFLEDELFTEVLFDGELLAARLFDDELPDKLLLLEDPFDEELFVELVLFLGLEIIPVIPPSVVLVFLGSVLAELFGIFLISLLFVCSGLWILTLRRAPDSVTLVGTFLSRTVLSFIFPLLVRADTGCVLDRLIRSIFFIAFRLRATLETFFALS